MAARILAYSAVLQVQELGLQSSYTHDLGTHSFIKKMMALPFLPEEEIEPIFQRLQRHSSEPLQQFTELRKQYLDQQYVGTLWLDRIQESHPHQQWCWRLAQWPQPPSLWTWTAANVFADKVSTQTSYNYRPPDPSRFREEIRDFKIQRRGRQRERQKNNRLYEQNNNFARASRSFVHFFARFCTTTTWKCITSRFMEYVKKQRRNFISLAELGYSP